MDHSGALGAGRYSGSAILPDGGVTWLPIPGADAVAFQQGCFDWNVAALTPGSDYLLEVSGNGDGDGEATSGAFRIIAPGATTFYVNDASTSNDVYCTAIGDDDNDGLAPATPKATLKRLLEDYALVPGDLVKIDTGNYHLDSTLQLFDSGSPAQAIHYLGSTDAAGTVIDRNDTGHDGIYLLDTHHIRLEGLKVTGAAIGIHVDSVSAVPVDGIEVVGCELYGDWGASALSLNNCTNAVVQSNLVHDNPGGNGYGYSLSFNGSGTVSGNHCYNHSGYGGIYVYGFGTVSGNICFSNYAGINVSVPAGLLTLEGNTCYQNIGAGLSLSGSGNGSAVAIGNRSYLNGTGLQLSGVTAGRNVAYSNTGDGIYVPGGGTSSLQNNLVYANGSYNVHIYGGWPYGAASVLRQNNTLYGGNGLFVDNGSANAGSPGAVTVTNRNNIIWAQGLGQVAISVGATPVSPASLNSDYNDLYATGGASVGFWLGTQNKLDRLAIHHRAGQPEFLCRSRLCEHRRRGWHSGRRQRTGRQFPPGQHHRQLPRCVL